MKKNLMKYKNYYGSCFLSEEDFTLYGKIEFIRDLVTFEASDAVQMIKEFHLAVDDYLATCKNENREPERPFKGSFNVRIGAKLHEKVTLSLKENESLNSFIVNAIKDKVS